MAKARIKLFRSKTLSDGTHPLILEIYHTKVHRIYLKKYALADHWDFKEQLPKKNHPNQRRMKLYMQKQSILVEEIMMEMDEEQVPFTIDEFKARYFYGTSPVTFSDAASKYASTKSKVRTKEYYLYVQKVINKQFPNILLQQFSSNKLKQIETTLYNNGSNDGGVGYIMRGISAVINFAIRESMISYRNHPFDSYRIPSSKPKHVAVTGDDLKKLLLAKLDGDLKMVRDMWATMFFLRGMEFIDLVLMKKSDIEGGVVRYKRSKTGKEIEFNLPNGVARFMNYEGERLFPIIPITNQYKTAEEVKVVQNKRNWFDKKLKQIAKKLGINSKITSKSAKHSMGEQLFEMTSDTLLIQGILNHEDFRTSQRYTGKKKEDSLSKVIEEIEKGFLD